MPSVMLISHTPEPVKTVAAAAKLCYSSSEVERLMEGLTERSADDFVRMLMSLGHESPMEHVSFTFGVSGVSRAFLAQITRHRIASYSVQSQRYVEKSSFNYVVPPEIAACEEAREEFLHCMRECQQSYDTIGKILAEKYYGELLQKPENLEADTDKLLKQARKMALEDARFVLPNACDTKMIVTMNTRSLYNFFAHRLCTRAQWEIREVANQMLELVREAAPVLFERTGPPCAFGACHEGAKSCGRQSEMRARYNHGK